MNYGQVIDQIRDLGFADDSEIEEFGELVPHAINRAITEISLNYAPVHGTYDIHQPFQKDENGTPLDSTGEEWDDNAYYEYVMPDDFLKFDNTPVKRQLGEGIYQRFNDFETENDDTIIMSGAYEGTFRVFYVADHEAFTEETDRETAIPLPLKAHHLVPLLASYYVWLDDDQAKAMEYYSKYQQTLQLAIAKAESPKARVRTDWGGGLWL